MHLPAPHGHDYYSTFYVLAVLTLLLTALYEGHRRRYPLRPWLVLLSCWLLAFIVGTKLITMPWASWLPLLQGGGWPGNTARSVLGGALSGGLVVLALRRWLGFGWRVFDALALPLSAGLVVQCVGCLLTGCCFGEVSSAGLVYAAGTPPWWAQVAAGLIPASAAYALPVVPTQLLALLLCLGTSLVLWGTRNRAWAPGSWAALQTGLLLLGRFALEFWRDPAGEPVGAAPLSLGGVSMLALQWALLPLGLLALAVWSRRRQVVAADEALPQNQPIKHLVAVLGLLLAAAALGPGALTLPEVVVVKALLLAVLLLERGALLLRLNEHGSTRPRLAALPLGLAFGLLLLTSQVEPTKPAPQPEPDASPSFTLTVGGRRGRYEESSLGGAGGGCNGGGGPTYRTDYDNSYAVAGGEAAYTFNPNITGVPSTVGVGLWGGEARESIRYTNLSGSSTTFGQDATYTMPLYSINPFIAGEKTQRGQFNFGYRVGAHIGRFSYSNSDKGVLPRDPTRALPDMMLWMGARRLVFGQIDFGSGLNGLGQFTARHGIGSGLGHADGRYVLLGVAVPFQRIDTPALAFLSANVPVGKSGLSVEPYLATNMATQLQLSLRMSYRINLAK